MTTTSDVENCKVSYFTWKFPISRYNAWQCNDEIGNLLVKIWYAGFCYFLLSLLQIVQNTSFFTHCKYLLFYYCRLSNSFSYMPRRILIYSKASQQLDNLLAILAHQRWLPANIWDWKPKVSPLKRSQTENLNIEPNTRSIDKLLAKLWPF